MKEVGKSESGGDRAFKTQNGGMKLIGEIILKFLKLVESSFPENGGVVASNENETSPF